MVKKIACAILIAAGLSSPAQADPTNNGYLCKKPGHTCSQSVKITGIDTVRNATILRVWAGFTEITPDAISNPAGCTRNHAVHLPLATTDELDRVSVKLMKRVIFSAYLNQLSAIFLVSGNSCSDDVIIEDGEEVNVSFPVLTGIEVSRISYGCYEKGPDGNVFDNCNNEN